MTGRYNRSGYSSIFGSTTEQTSSNSEYGTLGNYHKNLINIFTKNLTELKKIVNKDNVNHLMNNDGYTILHYAVLQDDKEIIKYLLECGADPDIKNRYNKKSFDIATEDNKIYLYEHFSNTKFSNLNKVINDLKIKNEKITNENLNLVDENKFLKRCRIDLDDKIDVINKELVGMKRQRDDTEKAFSNLNKRYTDLEKKMKTSK